MRRRELLGFIAMGAAAGEAVARQIAQRIEGDSAPGLRFINRKSGLTRSEPARHRPGPTSS